MKFEVKNYKHAVGEFNFHIQITPVFRQNPFEDGRVLKLTKAYISAKMDELKIQIVAMEFGPDHLHIFVADCKNYAPCKIVQYIKGFSSLMLRKNHWNLFRHKLWRDKFWSEGYFCRSIGSTTTEAVEFYIKESQQRHWN